jgi:hypothetical protein
MTKVAWAAKEDEIVKATPGMTKERFTYNLSRASFEREWGSEYKRPGVFARILAFLFRVLPKVGPLKAFAFRAPGPEAQRLFQDSFNTTLDHYRAELEQVRNNVQLDLQNTNLDTGKSSPLGSYKLADKTYNKLLGILSERKTVDNQLRELVLSYFKGAPRLDRKTRERLAKLAALRTQAS